MILLLPELCFVSSAYISHSCNHHHSYSLTYSTIYLTQLSGQLLSCTVDVLPVRVVVVGSQRIK
jgi:hypothetical protein